MKKILSALTLVLTIFTASVFAEDSQAELTEVAVQYTNWIFEETKWYKETNSNKLYELSAYLTPEQRAAYYEEEKKSGVCPFLLNLLVGFGVGSFVQGDKGIGALQLVGSTAGLGMLIGGAVWSTKSVSDGKIEPGAYVLVGVGSVVQLASLTVGCIRPWMLANKRNRKLRNALRVDEKRAQFSFAPVISPAENKYGLITKISF